ncbi:MAG: ATP-binding protein [Victivallales bacterium]|nr:ATP-binding protein [Victivallales bacterium]
MREKVFERHSFAEDAIKVFEQAEKYAHYFKEKRELCSHVFVACVKSYPEIIHKLLGREISKLPSKYNCSSERKFNRQKGKEIDFAQELSSLFLDSTPGTAFQLIKDYYPKSEIGVAEVAFALMFDPTEEICDILIANGFKNDAAVFATLLKENYLKNCRVLSSASPRKRMLDIATQGEKFEAFMKSFIRGQDKAIEELSALFTNFWFRGNNSLPYVVLLLSKTGGGRSYFADTMQRAFVDIGLQAKAEMPLDMGGFLHDMSCEADLLGDAKSYRNSRSGKLHKMAASNKRGMLVFEDIQEGTRYAKGILRTFTSNLAYDKYFEETILIPFNIVVFTMKVTDEQYRFIMEKGGRNIDAKLMNQVFLPQNGALGGNDASQMAGAAGLWQRADKIVLLEQLPEEDLRSLLVERISKLKETLRSDYEIEMQIDDMEQLVSMVMLSVPKEFSPRELLDAFSDAIDEKTLLQAICRNHDIRKVEIVCKGVPKYPHEPDRRIIRGDYLAFTLNVEEAGDALRLTFGDMEYRQQERIDCADYRIERPKGIDFKDIVGLDDVISELLDTLAYITNNDAFKGKAPAPPKNYILYGPPGTGKTSLAVALANVAGIPVFFASSSIFTDPRKISDMFRKANEMAPAIVVLEEFNSIGDSSQSWKRDIVNELLAIMDGVQKSGNIMVLASTNHIEQIEEALLRSERFGRCIKVDYPTAEARTAYVHSFERKYGFELPCDVLEDFVAKTERVSIADIKGMLGYALRGSVRMHQPIDAKCLDSALQKFRKTFSKAEIGFIGGNSR